MCILHKNDNGVINQYIEGNPMLATLYWVEVQRPTLTLGTYLKAFSHYVRPQRLVTIMYMLYDGCSNMNASSFITFVTHMLRKNVLSDQHIVFELELVSMLLRAFC